MCYRLVSAILRAPMEIDSGAKLVLLTLADLVKSGEAVCNVRQATIAKRTGCGERTVRQHLVTLETAGHIQRQIQRRSDGTRTADMIAIDFPPSGKFCRLDQVADSTGSSTGRKHSPQPAGSAGQSIYGLSKQEISEQKIRAQGALDVEQPEPRNMITSGNKKAAAIGTVPTWLDADAWRRFVAHRRAMRKPLTEDAARLAIQKLNVLRAQGHAPASVIDQSILGYWPDLYPIRDTGTRARGRSDKREGVSNNIFAHGEDNERDITEQSKRVG